jgi:hypothetical protein
MGKANPSAHGDATTPVRIFVAKEKWSRVVARSTTPRTSALVAVRQADGEAVGRRDQRTKGPTALQPPEGVASRRRRMAAPSAGGIPQSPSDGSHPPALSVHLRHPFSMMEISPF